MKTVYTEPQDIRRKWHLIDAKGRVLGRLATQVARLLRGKNKIHYAPHLDAGDFVVLINANQIHLSGEKWNQKTYYSHSRYIGSLKQKKASTTKPETIIRKAVQGMLSKNKLRDQMMKKLKIYPNEKHPHQAQDPQTLDF